MKKFLSASLIVLLLLTFSMPLARAEGEAISVSASVNRSNIVTITGQLSAGADRQVALKIVYPSGKLYLKQLTSGVNGAFSWEYQLSIPEKGTYSVSASGEGVETAAMTEFVYQPGSNPGSGPVVPVTEDPPPPAQAVQVSADELKRAFGRASEDAKGLTTAEIRLDAHNEAGSYAAKLPASFFASGEQGQRIRLSTPIGEVTVPAGMLAKSNLTGAEHVELSVGTADLSGLAGSLKEKIGNHPVIELTAKVGDATIAWNNPDAPVTVSVKYTLAQGEDPDHIVIWYVNGQGAAVPVPNAKFDPAAGQVTFTTTHFSLYAAGVEYKTFSDLAGYEQARKEIEALASRGVINGVSGTQFSPSTSITRGDFITLIVRALGLSTEIDSNQRFADVKVGSYYEQPVSIAHKLGLIDGIGNSQFAPARSISRQDMMVVAARALKAVGKAPAPGTAADLAAYLDGGSVSAYAVESVAGLLHSGIAAADKGYIGPKEIPDRAYAAVLLYNMLEQ